MSLSYSDFLALTTFGNSHLAEGDYVLLKDGLGNVLGIEAGARYQCDDPWLNKDKVPADAIAKHRENARLEFPITAEELVHWISNQGGDVQLQAEGLEELTQQLRSHSGVISEARIGEQPGSPMTAAEAGRRGADNRHKENRDKKEKAIALYRARKWPNKDEAAEVIEREIGMAFATVRDWLKGV